MNQALYHLRLLSSLSLSVQAFVHSVAPERRIQRLNNLMVVFFVIYAVCAFLGVAVFGTHGLIVAGMINMLCRIGSSASYIREYFQERSAEAFSWRMVSAACLIDPVSAFKWPFHPLGTTGNAGDACSSRVLDRSCRRLRL